MSASKHNDQAQSGYAGVWLQQKSSHLENPVKIWAPAKTLTGFKILPGYAKCH